MTQLSPKDRQLLTQHLENRFDSPSLRRLLLCPPLDKRLDHITTAENYRQIVDAVVDAAEREGFLPDLLKAVISEREFLRRDLQGILDRYQIDPPLRPLMDELRKILLQCPRLNSLAKHCFQESRPMYSEWVQPEGEMLASNYADHLAIFSANKKGCYPILRYVHLLIERGREQGFDDQQKELQKWLQQTALCLAKDNEELAEQLLVSARTTEEQSVTTGWNHPPTLFVQIESSDLKKTPYKVNMSFFPKHPAVDLPPPELMTLEQLKSKLQDRLRKIAEEFDWADLEVHFILPNELLVNWDADQWPLPLGDLQPEPELGYSCRVLTRSLKRAQTPQLLKCLTRRWQELKTRPDTPCAWLDCFDGISHCQSHVVICLSPQCQQDLYKWVGNAKLVLGAALHPAPGPLSDKDATATLNHLFLEGVPAIFWLRSTAASSDANMAIKTLQALVVGKCLRDLPDAVWKLRRTPGFQSTITLIWDDPNWLPVVIERQARLQAPLGVNHA